MKVYHVKKARKDFPEWGIRRGQPYWWWRPRNVGTVKSPRPPNRADLTGSDKLARLYEAEDSLPVLIDTDIDLHETPGRLLSIAVIIGQVADEYETSANNLPESLQYSDFADGMRNRVDGIRKVKGDVESAAKQIRSLDKRLTQRPYAEKSIFAAATDILDKIDFSGCYEGETKPIRKRRRRRR